MGNHRYSQWGIIKHYVEQIERLNNVRLGNQSWNLIKEMDKELTDHFYKREFPNDKPVETAKAFKESWGQVMRGETHPIETLWDDVDDD